MPVAPDLDWEPDRPCPRWDGVVGVVVLGVDVMPVEPVAPVLPLGAAAAPAMPAAAPPVASAPATIVAPSSFDTCIGQTSWWWKREDCLRESSSIRALSGPVGAAKARRRCV